MRGSRVLIGLLCLGCVVLLSPAAEAAEWVELQPDDAPSERRGAVAEAVAGRVYLFGGQTPGGMYSDELWAWDDAATNWEQIVAKAPGPSARAYHNMVVVNERLYVAFGLSGGTALNDLWEYNPATGTWRELVWGDVEPEPRYMGGMAHLGDGMVYVTAGWGDDPDPLQSTFIANFNAIALGAKGPSVSRVAPFPTPNYGAVFAALPLVAGNLLAPVVFFGNDGTPKGTTGDSYYYDVVADEWHQLEMQGEFFSRILPGTAKWGPNIWIVGGEKGGGAPSKDTQKFSAGSSNWSQLPPMLLDLAEAAAAVIPPAPGAKAEELRILLFGGVVPNGDSIDYTFMLTTDEEVESTTRKVVPAGAHGEGNNNTFWTSDVEFHNRGTTDSVVTIGLLRKDRNNSSPETATLTVAAGRSLLQTDVLGTLFTYEGAGALRIDYTGDLLITSRTHTPEPAKQGGTFGQFIPAVSPSDAVVFGDEARLIQLTRSADSETGFRTNYGFVNVTNSFITVEAEAHDGNGDLFGTYSWNDVAPWAYVQVGDLFGALGAGDVEDGFVITRTTTEGGAFLPWASVVDNITGDPIFISVIAALTQGAFGYVAAAANVGGLLGTNWHSDLQFHNNGQDPATGHVALLKINADNSNPEISFFNVPVGESRRWEDLLGANFGFPGSAALRIRVGGGSLIATSRTFNDLGEEGTFGQFIPCVNRNLATSFAQDVRLIQLARSSNDQEGFRTNIGFVNVTAETITVEVDLYSADGTLLGTLTRELPPYSYKQIGDAYGKLPGVGDVADGFAVVRTTTEGGMFFTYASVVDNATGDPIYIPGM